MRGRKKEGFFPRGGENCGGGYFRNELHRIPYLLFFSLLCPYRLKQYVQIGNFFDELTGSPFDYVEAPSIYICTLSKKKSTMGFSDSLDEK